MNNIKDNEVDLYLIQTEKKDYWGRNFGYLKYY